MDNIDSVLYIDIIIPEAGFHHGHPEFVLTELQCSFPPRFQPKYPMYSEAHAAYSQWEQWNPGERWTVHKSHSLMVPSRIMWASTS